MKVERSAGVDGLTRITGAARFTVGGLTRAVQGLGQDSGRRGLACSPGTTKQVGVQDAAFTHRVLQGGHHVLLASDLREPSGPEAPVERRVLHEPTLQRPRDPDRWRQGVSSAEGVGFEPTVTVKPHTRSRRAESSALASLRDPTREPGSGRQGYPARRRDTEGRNVPQGAIRATGVSLSGTRSGVWRSGPVRPEPVNRVRAGRQQLSAEPPGCRRSPGRHARGRVPRRLGLSSTGWTSTPPP